MPTKRLNELDARVGVHDEQLAAIIEAIRQFAAPPPTPRRELGLHTLRWSPSVGQRIG